MTRRRQGTDSRRTHTGPRGRDDLRVDGTIATVTQLQALALTLGIEAAAGALAARWIRRRAWQVALTFAAASLCTHPMAWTTNAALTPWMPFAPRAAIVEIAVALAEGAMLGFALRVRPGPAVLVATAVNAASFGVGLIIWWFGWF